MTQLKVTKDQAEVYLGKMEVGIAQKKKERKEEKKKSVQKNQESKSPISKCYSILWVYNVSEMLVLFLWI